MKKFAILFALLASIGVAQAQVSVFGTMDAGFADVKAPGGNTSQTNFTSGGMTTSHIGVKGSEDLGNGTRAVFELSSFLNTGNGATLGGTTANTFARSAFVGLSNNKLGTVTLGRQINPSFLPIALFNAYGDSGAYGPLWHATYFGNSGNPTTQVYNDTAWDNAISYQTPQIGGAVVTAVTSKNATGGDNVGANALYFKGNLGLMAFYQRTEVNSSGSFQNNIYANQAGSVAKGVGASYDFKVAKVFATFSEADHNATNIHSKTSQVSTLIPAGPGSIMAEYAHTSADKTYVEYAVGYDYKLSKRTDVYATVGRTEVTGLSHGQTIGAGLRLSF